MAVDSLNLLIDKQLADKVDYSRGNLTVEDSLRPCTQIGRKKPFRPTAFVKSQLARTETK